MLLTFDFSSDTPLYIQLRNQIIIGIADGRLISGEKLPTVRALSKAYQLLKQEGYITTDRRSGAAVAPRGERGSVSEETLSALRLSLSELRLAGFGRAETLELCDKLYGDKDKEETK